MHFFTEPPLRADAEAVADEQHPDHQFGINRGPACCTVERRQMPPQPIEIDEAIDGTQHVIGGNVVIQPKLIEQALLRHQPIAHHRRSLLIHPQSNESGATNRRNR